MRLRRLSARAIQSPSSRRKPEPMAAASRDIAPKFVRADEWVPACAGMTKEGQSGRWSRVRPPSCSFTTPRRPHSLTCRYRPVQEGDRHRRPPGRRRPRSRGDRPQGEYEHAATGTDLNRASISLRGRNTLDERGIADRTAHVTNRGLTVLLRRYRVGLAASFLEAVIQECRKFLSPVT